MDCCDYYMKHIRPQRAPSWKKKQKSRRRGEPGLSHLELHHVRAHQLGEVLLADAVVPELVEPLLAAPLQLAQLLLELGLHLAQLLVLDQQLRLAHLGLLAYLVLEAGEVVGVLLHDRCRLPLLPLPVLPRLLQNDLVLAVRHPRLAREHLSLQLLLLHPRLLHRDQRVLSLVVLGILPLAYLTVEGLP